MTDEIQGSENFNKKRLYLPSYELDHYIMVMGDFLTEEECNNGISELENKIWKKHEYHNVKDDSYHTYDDDLEVILEDSQIHRIVMNKLYNAIGTYISHYNTYMDTWKGYSPVRFNRYSVGQNMKPHVDHIRTIFGGDMKGVPILTCVGLLNDDFEGGEFLVLNDINLKMKRGDLVVFPSTFLYPHEVKTVTEGKRYSFVSWVY